MKTDTKNKENRKPIKTSADPFLLDLLHASSPSGYEFEAQKVIEKYVSPVAESLKKDALGNRIATINSKGSPPVVMMGHMGSLIRLVGMMLV